MIKVEKNCDLDIYNILFLMLKYNCILKYIFSFTFSFYRVLVYMRLIQINDKNLNNLN